MNTSTRITAKLPQFSRLVMVAFAFVTLMGSLDSARAATNPWNTLGQAVQAAADLYWDETVVFYDLLDAGDLERAEQSLVRLVYFYDYFAEAVQAYRDWWMQAGNFQPQASIFDADLEAAAFSYFIAEVDYENALYGGMPDGSEGSGDSGDSGDGGGSDESGDGGDPGDPGN